jgi:[ribosomal protein S18]-alanine N-acetyltransferase
MKPKIRTATPDDIDAIRLIEGEGQDRWSRVQFADELKLNFSTVHVLLDGDDVIGFAVTWNVAGDIQLNNIGVRNQYRRRGMGSLLMSYIVISAAKEGYSGRIYLEVSAENAAAQMFYRKHGFIETGRRKNYYDGVDAILMERGPTV